MIASAKIHIQTMWGLITGNYQSGQHRHLLAGLTFHHFVWQHTAQLTATEIHEGAAFDMYTYCRKYDLSQVWAYMWNCWYSPKQWPLWARSAAPEIPRLGMFNRPRLDLVVHVLITRLLPRVRVTLATVLGNRCIGRAALPTDWQNEF